jgi:hypothetical protein
MSDKSYTAQDLDRMSPQERQRAFDESIVTDLTDVPAHLQRLVDNAATWVEEHEASRR